MFLDGFLQVDKIHKVYWVEYGNPNGYPILVLHGGPGGASKEANTAYFDLDKFKIVMMDQRGCGYSQPNGELKNNTTHHLLSDIENLLKYRKIQECILAGGSWGSTLALLYAQKHPEAIKALILRGIFLAREEDDDWLFYESKKIYPDLWNKFLKDVPKKYYNHILQYLFRMFEEGDLNIKKNITLCLNNYELAHMLLFAKTKDFLTLDAIDVSMINSVRIFLYYATNKYFLTKNQILKNITRIINIPIYMVHGRYDMACPLEQAWKLHQHVLLNSKLKIINNEGHKGERQKIIWGNFANKIKIS
jgi:proline iminopeptidase